MRFRENLGGIPVDRLIESSDYLILISGWMAGESEGRRGAER